MERWKPIPGYEGIYEASDMGRIRSAPGKQTTNKLCTRTWQTRILKPTKQDKRRQDERVNLWKDGTHKKLLVSRLVASAWLGSPGEGMTVNHINGIPSDNRVINLEWVTAAENIKKGFEAGLFKNVTKSITLFDGAVSYSFPSEASASRFLGRNNAYVSACIGNHRTIRSRDMVSYTISTEV